MDKLRAMQTFVAIVEEGSLTRAAQKLGSSLPATVRTLAALEEDLKVRLLNRTTRRLSLTEEGRDYLASCRRIIGAVDEAEWRLSDRQKEAIGKLTVTAPVLFGQLHVAPIVTRFLQTHPKVECRLVLLDRVVNLLEEGIDLGIRIGRLEDSGLIAHEVGKVRRVIVASPSYLARHGAPEHPGALSSHNCIVFSGNGRASWIFREKGREKQVAVSGNLECNLGLPAVEACVAGLGLGQFLSYQVASQIADGKLVEVLSPYVLEALPVNVVYPHAGLLPSRTRIFLEWARKDLASGLAL